jgi:hypothetical protein
MPWENGMLVPSPEMVAAYESQIGGQTCALYDDDGELAAETCPDPCDDDCEIGPEHCLWHHQPSHKRGWHDPAECDERTKPRYHPSALGPGDDE